MRVLNSALALTLAAGFQLNGAPLAGCFTVEPPGTWSELLQHGQPGEPGDTISAEGPNYTFSGAQITFVTNDVTGEWDWIVKYEGGTLLVTNDTGAAWFSPCDAPETFGTQFPEVWVKSRSTRYASTNDGYLEFQLAANNGSVSLEASYAGKPLPIVLTNGTIVSDNLIAAEICIGSVVNLDIRPGCGPNPLNIRSRGVLPVAIRGTADFDVNTIDPASLKLACVSPLRWFYADVSRDRMRDLVLKFDTQAIVAQLGEVVYRQKVTLVLTGLTKDGVPISGRDEVTILGKPKPKPEPKVKPTPQKHGPKGKK